MPSELGASTTAVTDPDTLYHYPPQLATSIHHLKGFANSLTGEMTIHLRRLPSVPDSVLQDFLAFRRRDADAKKPGHGGAQERTNEMTIARHERRPLCGLVRELDAVAQTFTHTLPRPRLQPYRTDLARDRPMITIG